MTLRGGPVKSAFTAALAWCASACVAHAQPVAPAAFPVKPLRLIVGFAAGGGGDILTRAYAAELREVKHALASLGIPMPARALLPSGTLVLVLCGQPAQK